MTEAEDGIRPREDARRERDQVEASRCDVGLDLLAGAAAAAVAVAGRRRWRGPRKILIGHSSLIMLNASE